MFEGLFEQELPIDPLQEDLASQCSVLPTCKGIVLLADENRQPVQLLMAANMRRTALARLCQTDPEIPRKKADLSNITRHIFFLSCHNSFRSSLTHLRIARRIWPDRYLEQVILPRQQYIRIDPSALWPVFTVSSKPFADGSELILGLFPGRKSADELIQTLLDVFEICKRPDLIASPEQAKSCPYLQMNTCPAPCVGRISREDYLSRITMAIGAITNHRTEIIGQMNQQMQQYARQMDFEKARSFKDRLERLRILGRPAYTWTDDLSKLTLLHIDRSARRKIEGKRNLKQGWAAFVVRSDRIEESADFFLDDLESVLQNIQSIVHDDKEMHPSRHAAEELALVGFHLFRSRPEGVWINITSQLPSAEQVYRQIQERYRQQNRKPSGGVDKEKQPETDIFSQ
ncbi:MAG: UvrB/UvrC motif-containing protein [Sedimentisphaerales bacterium]|nr:UvrB/UvrC motif-containing protein [Sedimentisphaerales bacterium]